MLSDWRVGLSICCGTVGHTTVSLPVLSSLISELGEPLVELRSGWLPSSRENVRFYLGALIIHKNSLPSSAKLSGNVVFNQLVLWVLEYFTSVVIFDKLASSEEYGCLVGYPSGLLHIVCNDNHGILLDQLINQILDF